MKWSIIKLDKKNRMIRPGAGLNDGYWFVRIDLWWFGIRVAQDRPASSLIIPPPIEAEDVEWIVNDLGELGVLIDGQCYFCYKGRSLIYADPRHSDGSPMLYRVVGKREFGEVVWPFEWVRAGRGLDRYKVECIDHVGTDAKANDPRYHWKPLPAKESK